MPFFQFPCTDPEGQPLRLRAHDYRTRAAHHDALRLAAARWLGVYERFVRSPRVTRVNLLRLGRRVRQAEERVRHHAELALHNHHRAQLAESAPPLQSRSSRA